LGFNEKELDSRHDSASDELSQSKMASPDISNIWRRGGGGENVGKEESGSGARGTVGRDPSTGIVSCRGFSSRSMPTRKEAGRVPSRGLSLGGGAITN